MGEKPVVVGTDNTQLEITGAYLYVEVLHGLLAIESVKQNLASCHDRLRPLQQNSALLYKLATVHPKGGFCVLVDAIFARWTIFKLLFGKIEVVKRCVDHYMQV